MWSIEAEVASFGCPIRGFGDLAEPGSAAGFPCFMHSRPLINHPAFAWSSVAILVGALLASVWLGARGEWLQAAGAGAVAGVSGAVLLARRRLPAGFGALIATAGAVNATGYILTLWHERTPFDEVVHAFTSFAGMVAIGWLVLRQHLRPGPRLFWSAVAIGLAIGLLWEGLEWLIGIIGDRRDTLMDLAMDGLGAVAAGVFLSWLVGRDKPHAAAELPAAK